MPKLLKTMSADQVNLVINHPIHREQYASLIQLISDLRSCRSFEDLYHFQQDLLDHILRIEQHLAACSRMVKRLGRGAKLPTDAPELRAPLDPSDVASWELERDVCQRCAKQLRSIGDALAWRVFNYERRVIFALSQNQPPGPMFGKVGLEAERAFISERWNADRCFALLHDLTSCIRIGDATVLKPSGTGAEGYLREIKTNSLKHDSKQMRRIRLAENAIRDGMRLPSDESGWMVPVDIPYRNHLKMLNDALDLAARRGVIGMKIPGGRALTAASLPRGYELWSDEMFREKTVIANEAALKRAGISGRGHPVGFISIDTIGQAPTSPPWASYPLPPNACASLITDIAVFAVTISSEFLIGALQDVGLLAQWALPEDLPEIQPGQVVLQTSNGRSTLEMRQMEMTRILQELPDLSIWAEGIRYILDRVKFEGRAWPYFSNENKAWA